MENKFSKNLFPLGLIVAIIAVAFFAAELLLKNIESKPDTGSSKAKDSTEVNTKAFESIQSPETSTVNISLDQSGFGRPDPFSPYK